MQRSSSDRNRLRVLKAINTHGPVTRGELPRLTGLSAGTISQLAAELVGRGLVVEARADRQRAGRPRVHLEIASDGPLVAGASITISNSLRTSFVDLAGRLRFEVELPIERPLTLDDLARSTAASIAEAMRLGGICGDRVEHVGIGIPGQVDSARGIVHFVATLEAPPFPFADRVAQQLGLPVTIENNILGMARAEHWHGAAQGHDTFTLLHLGLGLASACYAGGLPRTGVNGFAPELGHIRTGGPDDETPCYCGARGCAAVHASTYAIVRDAGLFSGFPSTPGDIKTIEKRFDALMEKVGAGDHTLAPAFRSCALHLGLLVAGHINSCDPGVVIIMLPDPRMEAMIAPAFRAALEESALSGILAATKISFVARRDNWERLATAALALENT